MNAIQIVSAPCGSGKTFVATQYIAENKHQYKFLYTVPSIKLSAEIKQQLIDLKVQNVIEVNSETVFGAVKPNILQGIKQINDLDQGVLICITNTHTELPDFIRKNMSHWIHINDEVPKLMEAFEINLPYNHTILTNLLMIDPEISTEESYVIFPKSHKEIKKFLARSRDTIDDMFKPFLRKLDSGNFLIRVDKKSWDKLVINKNVSKDPLDMKHGNEKNKIIFTTYLLPTIEHYYSETIILGANLEDTALLTFWKDQYKINFQPHMELVNKLRLTEHTNGHLVKIVYGQTRKFSRHQAQKKDEQGLTGAEIHFANAKKVLDPTKPVLVLCNKDDMQYCPPEWTCIPPNSHGLNNYQHYTQFVFLGVFSFSPRAHTLFLDGGVSEEAIYNDLIGDPAYQSLLRTAIRNPNNTDTITTYCASKVDATSIAKRLMGCTISAINGAPQKVVGKVGRTWMENKRQRLAQSLVANYNLLLENNMATLSSCNKQQLNPIDSWETVAKSCTDNPGSLLSNLESNIIDISAYMNIYTAGTTYSTDFQSFTNIMQQWHNNRIIKTKEHNILINMNLYMEETRKIKDVFCTGGIILDIDKGDLSPARFNQIFHEKLKLSYFSYSTVSHMIDNQYRYRVVMPTSVLMTPDIYQEVYDYILDELKKEHYYTVPLGKNAEQYIESIRKFDIDAKISGIDLSKRNLSSVFYAPAKLESNIDNSFFYKSYLQKREMKSHVLDISAIISARYEKLRILAEQEKNQYDLVTEPIVDDSKVVDINNYKDKVINRIHNDVYAGHRSSIACSIAGSIKYWDFDDKYEVLTLLAQKGCDKSAMKSAYLYSGMSR